MVQSKTGNETGTKTHLSNLTKTYSPKAQDLYSTTRNSRQTVFAWRSKINSSELQNIQRHCQKPMEKLGYSMIENLTEKDNPNFTILVKSAEEIFKMLMLNRQNVKLG